MINVENQLSEAGLLAGIVTASDIQISESSSEQIEELNSLISQRAEQAIGDELRHAVRDMLRRGGFKPSGRNKPASEYLAGAAAKNKFPFINNVVDINNYISLKSGLPSSLLDLSAFGEEIVIRYGTEGESYVFNSSGQEIDVSGLISVCGNPNNSSPTPLGNPVKDSMTAKTTDTTNSVIAVVYAPKESYLVDDLEKLLTCFEKMLVNYASAETTNKQLV